MYDRFEVKSCLVIAPLEPAKHTWPQEARKWEHLRHLRLSLVLGDAQTRRAALARRADVYVINRENVRWLVDNYASRWPFDMVVIDELSSFKNARADRFKALRSVRHKIRRVVGLTGTPAPNGLIDLWPQVWLLDRGKALGRTLTEYRNTYFTPDKRNGPIVYSWRMRDEKAEQEIMARIVPFCVSMRAEDYLDLPERLDIRHTIPFNGEALTLYQKLERDTLLPYADGIIDGTTAAVLTNKLLQAAGGAAYDDQGKIQVLHDVKLKALDNLIEAANGQPVLVFYSFKHEAARIASRYKGVVSVKAPNAVQRWNAGEIPVLLAHPASAGHGLNLQQGGHIVIWYSLPFSLELYQQANARLHRQGQRNVVLVHHMLMDGTLDGYVLDGVLSGKAVRQDALIEGLRVRIDNLKETAKKAALPAK